MWHSISHLSVFLRELRNIPEYTIIDEIDECVKPFQLNRFTLIGVCGTYNCKADSILKKHI